MPELLTAAEVAEILRVSERTVDDLRRSGRLDCVMVSARRVRFKREQVDDYVTRCSTEPKRRQVEKPSRVITRTKYECIPMGKPTKGA